MPGYAPDLDPLSQAQVEANIERLCGELRKINADHYKAVQDAAEARYQYKIAYAVHYRAATGPQHLRDAIATAASEMELHAKETTEALERALNHAGQAVRAQLDGQRSVMANIRSAITYARGEGS